MALQTTYQQTPNLHKHFRKKSFPGIKITQSPFITVNGNSYSVVGQDIVSASPFYTYYDVLDENGNPASIDTTEKVYSYVAMTQLTTFMSKVKSQLLKPLSTQHKSTQLEKIDADLSEQLKLKYKKEQKVDIIKLSEENTKYLYLFEQMEYANEVLLKINYWNENNFQEFQRAWDAFWKVYQGRMSQLFQFYEFYKDAEIINKVVVGTQLDRIYRESKEMYEVFTKSIPVDTPFVEEVHDFIILMAQLGHAPYNSSNGKAFRPVGGAIDSFLQIVYKTMLWAVIPIVFLLLILDNVFFQSLIVAGSISFGSYVVDLLVRSYLESAVEKHILRERRNSIGSQPIIQTTYKEDYAALQRRRKYREETKKNGEIVAFPAVSIRFSYEFMMIGFAIIVFGFIVREATGGQYLFHYTIIGSVVAFIGIILLILLRGTVYLESNKIAFKRLKFPADSIPSIWTNRSGSKIYMGFEPRRSSVLKVPKRYRQQAKLSIIKWCDENGVPHLEHKITRTEFIIYTIGTIVIISVFIALFII